MGMASQKELVNEYLRKHQLVQTLEKALNECVQHRDENPLERIAKFLESTSAAEGAKPSSNPTYINPSNMAEANSTKNGYVLGCFKIKDPKYKTEYAAHIPSTIQPFGGKVYMAKPVPTAAYSEGGDYSMNVVMEFPSVAKALEWEESDAYKLISPKKFEYADPKTLLCVEGPSIHAEDEEGVSKGVVYAEFAVKDPAFGPEYATKIDATLEPFGGCFLVRNTTAEAAYSHGSDKKVTVVVLIEFPSTTKALAWQKSDKYQAIVPARTKYSELISFNIY